MPMEFETFEDKSSTINADIGVNKRLADMIYKWRLPEMKLAVGKPEYKTIIESKLVSILLLVWLYFLNNFEGHCCCDFFQGIPCTHNEIVMEVMWGIQRLMHKCLKKKKRWLKMAASQ